MNGNVRYFRKGFSRRDVGRALRSNPEVDPQVEESLLQQPPGQLMERELLSAYEWAAGNKARKGDFDCRPEPVPVSTAPLAALQGSLPPSRSGTKSLNFKKPKDALAGEQLESGNSPADQ